MSDAAPILVAAGAVALAGAIRSTWSPCGWSMLSAITPLGERSRGSRYGATAAWFVVGATAGGACLGLVCALLSFGGAEIPIGAPVRGALAAAVLGFAALVDAGLGGVRMPLLRRQVNEDWLGAFRPWIYGGGFGWQIGSGFATYLMTAAVPSFVLLGVLAGRPLAAAAIATAFGTIRGLAVLLVAGVRDPAGLARFHRVFERWGEPVRWCVALTAAVAAVLLALVALWPVALLLGVVVVVVVASAIRALRRQSHGAQAAEPWKVASPKVKMPPSAATSQ